MNTRTMLIVTGLIVTVAAISASTMIAKPVYAPTTCASCGGLFAPGQLKITNPAVSLAPGILARETGLAASQFAPGQEAKNLNSPG